MVKFIKIEKSMMIPDDSELKKVCKCLNDFIDEERCMLTDELNERTISHKLAEYLQKEFTSYKVDCEYNKMLDVKNPKKYIAKTLDLDSEEISSDDDEGITVYPDIIVHERKTNGKNHLVIEIKKKNYADKKRKNRAETYREFDFRKLKAYTKALQYTYGIYIEFEKDNIYMLKFFKNGDEIVPE